MAGARPGPNGASTPPVAALSTAVPDRVTFAVPPTMEDIEEQVMAVNARFAAVGGAPARGELPHRAGRPPFSREPPKSSAAAKDIAAMQPIAPCPRPGHREVGPPRTWVAPLAPAPAARVPEEQVFRWLQDLLEEEDVVERSLEQRFAALGAMGSLLRDDASGLLAGMLATHTEGLPVQLTEGEWLGTLKRFGVYDAADTISQEDLLELYLQVLRVLRDRHSPREALRALRGVPRGGPRLKDHYDCFEFRAKDSLGKIYRCREVATREPRMCKQVRKDKAAVPIDQIRCTIDRMKGLDHPNIPRIYDFVEDFNNIYVISAPMEGGELMEFVQDSYVQARALSEGWVAEVLQQVLEAIAYCHAWRPCPLTHRDLRPESVLFVSPPKGDGRLHVSVMNLGLSELFDSRDPDGWGLPSGRLPAPFSSCPPPSGMPVFTAPEVWCGSYGPRCDVWSCGCLMYLLLTGTMPFGPKLPPATLAQVLAEQDTDWRAFRHASTSALSLCRRMLAREELSRPSAAECLRHPWFGGLAGGAERIPKELKLETLSSLMQVHAQAKFYQVLMNVVATELKVGELRHVRPVFAQLDPEGTGHLSQDDLADALGELGVSAQNVDQVVRALAADTTGDVTYTSFIAGCVDLVDDKLDYMLWKIFTMVDEDHSGEISTVELEHFLSAACDVDGLAGDNNGGAGAGISAITGDVERYLSTIMDPELSAHELVALMAGGCQVVAFEDIKRFVLEGSEGWRTTNRLGKGE